MSRSVQIAVVGSGAAGERLTAVAEEVGRRLAQAGAVVVCGGLGGVMEDVSRGAQEADGAVIGIVPSDDPDDANPHCSHVVAAATGSARNLAVVASADAVIAIGGAWGTLSEIAHARQLGRPVVALESWRLKAPAPLEGGEGIERVADAADAVRRALDRVQSSR